MGKTTNILDLNNRLTKVEKENVAQNNYNSLKNRPKINGNLLTGDKTGTQLGLANAQDIGNLSDLTTTDKSSAVAAINEVKSGLNDLLYLNNFSLSFTATDMKDFLRQVINYVESNFAYNITLNMFGAWSGTCTFLLQVSRATSHQTIVSAIPQAGNPTVNKMWIVQKEANTYYYSTIDMAVVS